MWAGKQKKWEWSLYTYLDPFHGSVIFVAISYAILA